MSTISDLNRPTPPQTSQGASKSTSLSKKPFEEFMKAKKGIAEEDSDESLFELVSKLEETRPIEEEEKRKKKTFKTDDSIVGISPLPLTQISLSSPKEGAWVNPPVELEAAIALLFETMGSELTKIDAAGISETTITLSAERFPLLGNTKILVTEYSTAPKVFNVQIVTGAQAAQLLQQHAPEFLAAFDERKENFKIHRFEISLRRKEKPSKYDQGHSETEDGAV
jgi:hypothetical protein